MVKINWPKGWRVARIKSLFTVRDERYVKAIDGQIPLLSVSEYYGVADRSQKIGDDEILVRAKTLDGYKKCFDGDLVFNTMLAWKGALGICSQQGVVSPSYDVYKVIAPHQAYPKFYHYLFRTEYYKSLFKSLSTGIIESRLRLYPAVFLQMDAPLPPYAEQKKIVVYLDPKVAVVNALISNQEKQIEKLKEYRQAIITKAVTKGLDPNVPMKDSGIEWIGEIPNNVNVSSVKNFYDITLGKMLQPKQENENDTLEYYFCAANLGNDCLKTNDLKQMWFSVKEKEKYSLKRGDLLVVEGGDVASSSVISTDVSNIYFQNSIHRVRPIHGLNEYLHYYLIFVKGSGYFDVNCNKATIMHFTKDKFSNLPFLIRNTEEQKKIVTFLNKEETKINRLISIKEKKIEFLTNYKKSLIYEYVTGKKRVSL